MPAIPSPLPFPVRRGVTLLELLVVLVLMAVAAAVVLPALGVRAPGAGDAPARSARDVVIAKARRNAIQRGAPVHLRVAPDGVWALAAATDGELLSRGRFAVAASSANPQASVDLPFDLRIDAMGSCLPAPNARARSFERSFDALACRFAPDASP